MSAFPYTSRSEADTFRFAEDLARSLTPPVHILLYGELGAGKTSFTRGLASGFGLEDVEEVSSPTFTLINRYEGRVPIYHADLYRVDPTDTYDLGLDEIFEAPDAVTVIEWADRLDRAPDHAIHIELTYLDDQTRRIDRRNVLGE